MTFKLNVTKYIPLKIYYVVVSHQNHKNYARNDQNLSKSALIIKMNKVT